MADRGTPSDLEGKDDIVEDKPIEKVAERDPTRGLKKANKTLQTERDAAQKKLTDLQAEVERAKLSESEKAKAEFDKVSKERDDARAEALQAKAEREKERRISHLVAKHGLKDPEFGDLVLKKFDPDEHDDFDKFVTDFRKDKKYEPLFGKLSEDRILDDDGEEIVPEQPRPTKSKTGAKSVNTTEHEEFARRQWPGDKAKQEAYVANIANMGRGR